MNKYEVHLTVDPKHTFEELYAKGWGDTDRDDHEKILDIELSHGKHVKQLMVGFNVEAISFSEACRQAMNKRHYLYKDASVIRTKIEAHPANDKDQFNALLMDPKPIYFEAHWKVRIDCPVNGCGLMMSYNRQQPDIKYLTLRQYEPDRDDFETMVASVTKTVRTWLVKEPHMELCLFDTCEALDEGWEEETYVN